MWNFLLDTIQYYAYIQWRYYSAIKKNEVVIYILQHDETLETWLGEKSQVQKPIYYVIPFMGFIWTFGDIQIYKSIQAGNRVLVI